MDICLIQFNIYLKGCYLKTQIPNLSVYAYTSHMPIIELFDDEHESVYKYLYMYMYMNPYVHEPVKKGKEKKAVRVLNLHVSEMKSVSSASTSISGYFPSLSFNRLLSILKNFFIITTNMIRNVWAYNVL